MRVISPVSLPTYLSVVYRNNMSAVPASIHLKTNVDRIYLLLLKTVLSFPSLLSKTMSIFQDFFKTFLQFSQIQDYFQDLNEFINFKTFSSLEENVRTMIHGSEYAYVHQMSFPSFSFFSLHTTQICIVI